MFDETQAYPELFVRLRWAIDEARRSNGRFLLLVSHPSPQDFDTLNRAADMVGADKRVLVSQTNRSVLGGDRISCSLPELVKILR